MLMTWLPLLKDSNLQLFFFILTDFLVFGTCHIRTNKDSSILSTIHIDPCKGVIIQNSLPKGGPYTDPTGKRFGYGIFWTRVINQTTSPLELTINFPADSFAIFPEPGSYLKLFCLRPQ
jgi:hypothetical protein